MVYGSETRTKRNLAINWKRKILRKIYGIIKDNGIWKIRTNRELQEQDKDKYIITDIQSRSIDWLGHVCSMITVRIPKVIFNPKSDNKKEYVDPKQDALLK